MPELVGCRKWALTAVLALAFMAEMADNSILQAMYAPVGRALHASAVQLGTLTMWRGLVQAAVTPVIGSAGAVYNRATAWVALNGVGLALVLPCVQSLISDIYAPESRGRAFGLLLTIASVGQIAFNFLAIAEGERDVGRMQGWRFVFLVMAALALLVTVLVLLFGVEPRSLKAKQGAAAPKTTRGGAAAVLAGLRAMVVDAWVVFRVPTFVIVLAAEIVMVVGGAGAGYQILYFRLSGFTDIATAKINLFFNLGNAFGMLLGGVLGDAAARRYPRTARPLINMASMLVAGPLNIVLYRGMPGASNRSPSGAPGSLNPHAMQYGALLLFTSVVAPWEQANNAAMFSEVVPEALRTSVFAFDKCLTGALGALAAPLVGLLARRVFGGSQVIAGDGAAAPAPAAPAQAPVQAHASPYAGNLNNAHALESGLLWLMLVAVCLRFLIYAALPFTLPRDRAAAADPNPLGDPVSGAAADLDKAAGASKR
ncbi:hypothetical protein WJX81_001569 [Elliptochloris bilobata]|uniref:Major facilitator superfamily (MFS) profile domain-containing protein n=1 Tax=Elliptochloris bilobata TaxID=381761 RepID=A0AAW1SL87_9CHLO